MKERCTNIGTSDNCKRTSFLRQSYQHQPSSIQYTTSDNVRIYEPMITKEVKDVTYEYDPDFLTHVYSSTITQNGKCFTIFEQDKDLLLRVHSHILDDDCNLIRTMACGASNTWLLRDYDYCISYDHSFCILFNSEEQAHQRNSRRRRKRGYDLGENIFISLCKFNLDVSSRNSWEYVFYPNVFLLNLKREKKMDHGIRYWRYQHGFALGKCNLICISSQGNLTNNIDEAIVRGDDTRTFCLDLFSVEQSESVCSVKHLSQKDLSVQLQEKFPDRKSTLSEPLIILNNTCTKVLLKSYNLVYSITDSTLLSVDTEVLGQCFWVFDFEHGELLINIIQSFFGELDVKVEVLKQKNEDEKSFKVLKTFSVKKLLEGDDELESYYCHSVSNGDVKLFVEPQSCCGSKVYVIDPFLPHVVAQLKTSSSPTNVHVRNVLVNGNEVLVVLREPKYEADVEILNVFCLGHDRVYSLKYLASCAMLKSFSMNDVQKMKLPKTIKLYLKML